MIRWLAVLVVACSLGSGAGAAPQAEPDTNLIGCLKIPEGKLGYPSGFEGAKVGGLFRLRLTFASTGAPTAEVLYATAGEPFRSIVLDHVARYRLPCLADGERPMVVSQEFQFLPDGRRIVESPLRVRSNERLACLTGADRVPDYPMLAERAGEQGNVLAQLVFTSTGAPATRILYDGGRPRLAAAVREYLAGYRMPCWSPDDGVVRSRQSFGFFLRGGPKKVLKDSNLQQLLRAVADVDAQKVRFDLHTMGCPFEVRVEFWQPHASNVVHELASHDANRLEFLEWLRTLRLDLPQNVQAQITGDSMTVSVPCAVLDLL